MPDLAILVLNWRDTRHGKAGGAEVWTHEVFTRLVARGHRVTMFTARDEGALQEDQIDGIRVERAGGQVTTRLHAARWVRRQMTSGRRFDVVVEEINTLPYFARWWSRTPTVILMHQIAGEVWDYEARWPLSWLGRRAEPLALKACRGPAIALSASTRDDLLSLGFPRERVAVASTGVDVRPALRSTPGRERALVVYLGRVTPSKRVGDAVRALALARAQVPGARLVIVGRGPREHVDAVRRLAAALGVGDAVEIAGYIDDREKSSLLARAGAVVMCSVREGWGMAVTEANAFGTPAVVYRRPGLVDSTLHDRTGLVTDPTPAALAGALARLMTDDGLFHRLSAGALARTNELSWDHTADVVEASLMAAASRTPARRLGSA